MIKIKDTAILLLMILLFIPFHADASQDEVLCTGEDMSKEEIKKTIEQLNIDPDVEQVVLTREEQKQYIDSDSKSVICTYIKKLNPGSGIKVEVHNISYVTPEMITEAAILSGIKDVEMKFSAPYSVSGYSAITPAVEAYKNLSGKKFELDTVRTSCEILSIMGDLGRKLGNKKALQFINESIKDTVNSGMKDYGKIDDVLSKEEKRFNSQLSEDEKERTGSALKKLVESGFDAGSLSLQQKSISLYINDLSDTAYKYPFFEKIYSNIMMLLKKAALVFQH